MRQERQRPQRRSQRSQLGPDDGGVLIHVRARVCVLLSDWGMGHALRATGPQLGPTGPNWALGVT